MNMQEIQARYQQLCAELGHLTLQKRNVDARLQDLESAISKLNEQAGRLKEQEAKNAASPKDELKRSDISDELEEPADRSQAV